MYFRPTMFICKEAMSLLVMVLGSREKKPVLESRLVGLMGCIKAVFTSETDTEVVAHLVSEKVEAGLDPVGAVREVLGL